MTPEETKKDIISKVVEEVKAFFKSDFEKKTEAEKIEFSVDGDAIAEAVKNAVAQEVEPLNSKIAELEGKLTEKETEVTTIEASKQEVEKKVTELETELSQMPKATKTNLSPEGNGKSEVEFSSPEIPEDLQTPSDRLKSQFENLKFI